MLQFYVQICNCSVTTVSVVGFRHHSAETVCIFVSERANQSIQQLSSALEHLHADGEEVEEVRGSDGTLFTTLSEEDKAAWSQKTQSEAGDVGQLLVHY